MKIEKSACSHQSYLKSRSERTRVASLRWKNLMHAASLVESASRGIDWCGLGLDLSVVERRMRRPAPELQLGGCVAGRRGSHWASDRQATSLASPIAPASPSSAVSFRLPQTTLLPEEALLRPCSGNRVFRGSAETGTWPWEIMGNPLKDGVLLHMAVGCFSMAQVPRRIHTDGGTTINNTTRWSDRTSVNKSSRATYATN